MIKEKKTYYLVHTFFLVFFLALLYIVYHNYEEQKAIHAEQFNENQLFVAKQLAHSVQNYIDQEKRELHILADSPVFTRDSDRDVLRSLLSFYRLKQDDISTIRVYDKDGTLKFALPSKHYKGMIAESFADEQFFKRVSTDKHLYTSGLTVDDIGERVIMVAVPILLRGMATNEKTVMGVITATFRVNMIEALLKKSTATGYVGYVWGVDNNEEIIFHTKRPLLIGHTVESEFGGKGELDLYKFTLSMLVNESGKGFFMEGGKMSYAAYAPVMLDDESFWTIVVTTGAGYIQKINEDNVKNNAIFAAILFLLFFMLNLFIYKIFKRFIQIKVENEISEKKHEAERKYKELFENAVNIIFVVNKDTYNIESRNRSFVNNFSHGGYSLLGTSFLEMLDEENQKTFTANIDKTLGGESTTYELVIKGAPDSGGLVFSLTNTLLTEPDGSVSVQCIGVDITSQKQLSDELTETKNRLQAVFDGMHIGISMVSRDYDIIMVNKYQADWLNSSAEDMIGRKCYAAFRDRTAVCENCPAVTMLKENRPCSMEVKLRGQSGELQYYSIFAYPLFDANNEISSFITSVQDVTDVKSLETEVIAKDSEINIMGALSRTLNEKLDLDIKLKNVLVTLIDKAQFSRGIVFLMDKEIKRKVLRANINVPENFVTKLNEIWGSEDIITEFMQSRSSVTVDDIANNSMISFDLKKLLDGEKVKVFTIIPIVVKGNIIGILLMFSDRDVQEEIHDIRLLDSIGREIGRAVERARLREELKSYRSNLEKMKGVVQEKDKLESVNELAGVISHELNQPLTTIISYSEFLMDDSDEDSNAYQTLKVISEEAMRIAGMLKKITSITKYETKKYIGDTKVININEEDDTGEIPVETTQGE